MNTNTINITANACHTTVDILERH